MEYICLYFGAINVLITGDGKVFKMIIGSNVILDVAEMKYNDMFYIIISKTEINYWLIL